MAVMLPQLVFIEDALARRNFLTLSIEGDWIQPEASPRHGDYAMRISGTRGRADVLFAENRLLVETATRPLTGTR